MLFIVVILVPTFISFLREVDNPYEVQDYVNSYLGETPKSAQFAKDFIERRSLANKQKLAQQRLEDEVGDIALVSTKTISCSLLLLTMPVASTT